MPIVLEPDQGSLPPAPSSYASVAQVRAAVTVPDAVSDVEITQALTEAQQVVEEYTGRLFGSHTVDLTVPVDREGVAYLADPMPIIASVTWPNGEAISPDLYLYTPPTPYSDATLRVRARGGSSFLVNGASLREGGWDNLLRHHQSIRVRGTAGSGSVPLQVRRATVLLAGFFLGLGGTDPVADDAYATGGVGNLAREGFGYGMAVARPSIPRGVRVATTGLDDADKLLASYIKRSSGLVVA